MWLNMGLSFAQGITGFIQSSREQKYRQKLQEYNNKMVRLADAQNQNAITTNQNIAVEASVAKQFAIERQNYLTQGEADVAAAATDTAGRSVNQTLYQVQRSADEADSVRQRELEHQLAAFRQQRLNSSMQAMQQLDYSYIPKANPVTSMLGIGIDMYKIYQRGTNPTDIK